MSQTASEFHQFPNLAFELRSKIWEYAVPIYIQDLVDHLPPSSGNTWAERRRQALAGIIPGDSKLALRIRILESVGAPTLRFEENDFETLVNSLPISIVCHEVRPFVIQFCRLLVTHIRFEYTKYPLCTYEETKDGWVPHELPPRPETELFERLLWQPTILTVDMGEFKSAAHFVDMVVRFFGNSVQRLILDQVVSVTDTLDHAYWANSGAMPESIDATLRPFSEGDPTLICITRDRKVYISESFWQTNRWLGYLAKHLMKIIELFDVCLESLPHLEHLEVTIEISGMDTENSRIEMIYKRDLEILAVTSGDPLGWPSRGSPIVHLDSGPPSSSLSL